MDIYQFIENKSKIPHTKMFWEFCNEVELQFRIVYLLISFAQQQDQMKLIATKTLVELGEIPIEEGEPMLTAENESKNGTVLKGPATKAFLKVGADLYRNMFVRVMENFENYLADLLAHTYIKKPEMLKSKESLTIEEVLRFESREELIKYISEKKVNNLQMLGLKTIRKYVSEQHGLDWFTDEDESMLDQANLTRNLIVHNKSRVNYLYLKKNPECGHKIGHKLRVKKYTESQIPLVLEVASKLDLMTGDKFGLEMIPFIALEKVETD